MSVQDVEITETEAAKTPKRKAPARKSKGRSGSRKRASASRSSKPSSRRSGTRSRASASRTSPTDRMLRQGRSVVNRAYSFAEEARRAMPRMPRMPRVDLRMPRRSDFDALTDANPLVIGAIGLGLGVVLGTLMPQRVSSRLGELAGKSARSPSSRRRGRSNRGGNRD